MLSVLPAGTSLTVPGSPPKPGDQESLSVKYLSDRLGFGEPPRRSRAGQVRETGFWLLTREPIIINPPGTLSE
jgi:hypothetical protein